MNLTPSQIDLYRQAQPAIRKKYPTWEEGDPWYNTKKERQGYVLPGSAWRLNGDLYRNAIMTPPPISLNGRDLVSCVEGMEFFAITSRICFCSFNHNGKLHMFTADNPTEPLLRAIIMQGGL